MKSILMDNWGLMGAFDYLRACHNSALGRAETVGSSELWANFLTAIVLWEEVWQFQHYSRKSKLLCDIHNASKYDEDSHLSKEGYMLFEKICKNFVHQINLDDYPFLEQSCDFLDLNTPTINPHKYLVLSNALKINYFPAPNRVKAYETLYQQTFQNNGISSRYDLIKLVDKNVMDAYIEIVNGFGKPFINIIQPITFEYIQAKSRAKHSNVSFTANDIATAELNTALELRCAKSLVAYRQSMCDLEEAILNGNLLEMKQAQAVVNDVTSEMLSKKDVCKSLDMNLTFALYPAIDIECGILPVANIELPLKFKRKNYNIHTTFIRELLSFGLTGTIT